MRYRGGGVGHKYMREIEAKFENMSLERSHWNSRPKPPQGNSNNTSTHVGGGNSGGEESENPARRGRSGQNGEEDPVRPSGLREDQPPELGSGSTNGGSNGGDSESDDGDYVPPQMGDSDDEYSATSEEGSDDSDSPDSEGDSDKIESDTGNDSYGLADL